MRILISTLIISINFSLFAGDTNTVYLDNAFTKTKKSKAIYYKKVVEVTANSWYTEIHLKNGKTIKKGFYKTDKSKVKEGHFEEFYHDGNLQQTGNYFNDKKVGNWVLLYRTGQKKSYGKYDADGEKDSIWVSLHQNGKTQEVGNYIHGNKNGEWLGHFDDGKKDYVSYYNENGKLSGHYESYGHEEHVYDIGEYEDGDKIGEWKYFFNTGEPSGVVTYKNGEPDKSEYWNKNGKIVNQKKQVVNQNPSFPGGEQKMYSFLGNNMKYPPEARDNNYQGRVYVSFVVEKNGDITDVKILRGVHHTIDAEAMRVVNEFPKWECGINQNRKVRVRFNLPIVFKLQ